MVQVEVNAQRPARSATRPVPLMLECGAERSRMGHDNQSVRRTLRLSTAEGMVAAVMTGSGEAYFAAFALALGAGELTAGMIASLPMLAGAALQLVSPWAVARLGSFRRWTVFCALLQVLSLLPLIAGALAGQLRISLLFAAACLYWGAALAAGPAWNAWIETLVPAPIRTAYFARRSLLAQLAVLGGLLGAGTALQLSHRPGGAPTVFAATFGLAAIARLISARLLQAQPEAQPLAAALQRQPGASGLADAFGGHGGRLLSFMVLAQVAIHLAVPFFTPYMLGHLRLSYAQFASLTAAAYLARIVALRLIGQRARRLTAWQLLRIGALGIAPLPLLWTLSAHFSYLVLLQVLAGTLWACYELATFLLFFETIPHHARLGVLTYFNAASATASACGSALGGLIFRQLGGGWLGYRAAFGLSSVGRLLALLALPAAARRDVGVREITTRVLALRPGTGGLERPILPALSSSAASRGKPPLASAPPTALSSPPAARGPRR